MAAKFPSSSVVWSYFSKDDDSDKMARCNQCLKTFSYRTSLTNLKKHLMLKHSGHFKKFLNECKSSVYKFQPPVEAPIPSTSTSLHEVFKKELKPSVVGNKEMSKRSLRLDEKKHIDAMLLKLIVRTYQPFSILEVEDFIEFVQALNPKYELLQPKTISERLIPLFYSKCLKDQKKLVMDEAISVCLTIDYWTSYTMDTFIEMTAHFINKNFEFKTVLLKCFKVESSHTSNNLASLLLNTANEWGIEERINLCVTDNAANMINAVHSLNWEHLECIAHKLNICLQNALDLFNLPIKKVKIIVNHYRSNNETKDKLLDYQVTVQKIDAPLELVDNAVNRWNSTFYMLDRFVTLQSALIATMPNVDAILPKLSNEEWLAIKQLCKILKPFEHATRILSAEKYVFASKGIAVINGLFDVLSELKKKPHTFNFVIDIINQLEVELTQSFHDIEHYYNMALCTVLDPRYKLTVFINEAATSATKQMLKSRIEVMTAKDKQDMMSKSFDNETFVTTNNDVDDEIYLFRRRDKLIEKCKTETNINPAMFSVDTEKEVETYLNDEYPEDTSDPCYWWKVNQYKYPHLARLFLENFNIVTTSVPSDRLFSNDGNDISQRRTRLSERTAQQLVFLNANLKNEDYKKIMQ